MKVNTASWHYWLYKSTYSLGDHAPHSTNLCQYVRRLVLVAPLIWLVVVPFMIAITIPAVLLVVLFGLFLGLRPTGLGPDDVLNPYHRYVGYKLPKVAGIRIAPWLVTLVVGSVYGLYRLRYVMAGHPAVTTTVVVSIAAFISVIVLNFKLRNTETTRLDGAYFAAKKAKICPMVRFGDAPTDLGDI